MRPPWRHTCAKHFLKLAISTPALSAAHGGLQRQPSTGRSTAPPRWPCLGLASSFLGLKMAPDVRWCPRP